MAVGQEDRTPYLTQHHNSTRPRPVTRDGG